MTRGGRTALIVVVVIAAGLFGWGFLARRGRQPSSGSILDVILDDTIAETSPSEPFGQFFGSKRLDVLDYEEAILRAKDDPRINGLLLEVRSPSMGFAKMQELRAAITHFKDAGKWTVAWTETAGEGGPGSGLYYVASACDTIWLSPPGDINLTGLRSEVPFIRGIFDHLKIVPDFDHIGKYKNAKNFYTDKAMDPAYREAMESILDSLYRQLRSGIAASRHMTDDEVTALIDKGPYLGPDALEAKLVDRLGYHDELIDALKEKNGGHLPLVKVRKYLKAGRLWDHGERVALIYGVGNVTRGESDSNPVTGGQNMGSDTVAKAIRDAREDDSIKAIVFRVDSPGGSYVASDIIWREVSLTKGKKPIVVSMSDVAGSGGYYVAMAADRIVAQPGTITASIGVLAGKFVTKGFWDMVGLTSDPVQRGRHATYFSSEQAYTDEERALFKGWLQRVYKDFVGKVAQGRNKTFDEVHAIAQGRIWTGEDALKLGLVDELGGLPEAIAAAKKLAHIGEKESIDLVEVPEPKSFLESFFERDDQSTTGLDRFQTQVRSFIETGRLPGGDDVLSMPYVPDVR
ncbi:MAG TPA: signal peptide peptidase SppA [Candidatus Polarisedimenticolia bacterium]|jgi:protease-4|nr:signal peptide peptidase SppA [Candidatus Polarisedimenticolia bacterium]